MPLADALKVWDSVKESANSNSSDGIDVSFVTPTILALGKFSDQKIDGLITSLNQQPALIWNLSGKPFSQSTKDRLGNQILEVHWKTPGQYTQVPSVCSIFELCYSIKCWLDLNDDHVAVVHCANGRSRTGILIACLLKYIGAFESSSDAFNFFTSARIKLQSTPSLAPSYRVLFENIDNTVNNKCLPNPYSLNLKSISISGLPVDELPCIEVWDVTGPLFSSYEGVTPNKSCSWSAEYGDGHFIIGKDLIGDFSILCRFGGKHSLARDRTTLIFKYQNSTAFLPPDLIELKRQNIDVSPDYSDHIDADMFSMHITFENSVDIKKRKLSYYPYGLKAFEEGLDEISKQHIVEPESDKCNHLINIGCPSTYSTIALQLSNNNTEKAVQITRWMRNRVEFLQTNSSVQIKTSSICSICNDNSMDKRDQLVKCISCSSQYHTQCIGARRIPFKDTEKDRQNRDKYIAKNFGDWICSRVGCSPNSDQNSSTNAQKNESAALGGHINSSGNKEIVSDNSSSTLTRSNSATKHDQAAILLGLLASKGITIESLLQMGEDKQKETLSHISSIKFDSDSSNPTSISGKVESKENFESTGTGIGSRVGGGGGGGDRGGNSSSSGGGGGALTDNTIENSNRIGVNGNNFSKVDGWNHNGNSNDFNNVNVSKNVVNLKDDPRFGKYLKMIKVGLPKTTVADKMASDGVVSSFDEALRILELNPEEPIAQEFLSKSNSDENVTGPNNLIAVNEHPIFSKYFKMLKVGLPKEAVQAKMVQDGLDPSILDKNPGDIISYENADDNKNKKSDQTETESAKVVIKDHPVYAKYFKMLKVGLPKEAVKAKMQQEGADPSMLDKNPDDMVELNPTTKDVKDEKEELIAIKDHPVYAKYLKMLKVGLPKEAVKAKMQQEGADPSMLDKNPDDMISLIDKKPASEVKEGPKIAAQDHPVYSKYFKMLKVGLPKEAVKAKMKLEGADPSVLDMNPTDMIAMEKDNSPGEPKIALQDHPQLSKYFKMMKVGLAKDTVKAKMQQEGLDPSYLDRDPTELVPVDLSKTPAPAAEIKKKSPVLRKKRLHWKALDASKVREGTLWGDKDEDEDIYMDEAEFNNLFVESKESRTQKPVVKPQEKKQKVNLIDMKRGQNAGIALARIKISFEDVKTKIMHFEDESFTTDQLKSLEEYLPTFDEVKVIKAYTGDFEMLGQAEKYMAVMSGFSTASKRIQCMIFKQQFKHRVLEVKNMVSKIECACDDVKLSLRFKKLLKTILKVGNQLNDGADHVGFTVDSLLKLQSAKAFDKKTSILQYVVMLIYRNDKNCLHFTDDLSHVAEASRINMETIITERTLIRQNLKSCCDILLVIRENLSKGLEDPSSRHGIESMDNFFTQAKKICDDLDVFIDTMKTKYSSVLNYFGEEPTMLSHEFFATLFKFLQEFIITRESVDRKLKADEKKAKEMENKAEVKARRSSMILPSSNSANNLASEFNNQPTSFTNSASENNMTEMTTEAPNQNDSHVPADNLNEAEPPPSGGTTESSTEAVLKAIKAKRRASAIL